MHEGFHEAWAAELTKFSHIETTIPISMAWRLFALSDVSRSAFLSLPF